ncbi:MAG TPA: cupredoxin family copper-binding protein [Acidimicrobiia bacterium]|nr:cupredoxin family copper-binding protein [Acidimicrobiia bacterium]
MLSRVGLAGGRYVRGRPASRFLLEGRGSYFTRMVAARFSEDEVKDAFDGARKVGLYRGDGIGGGPADGCRQKAGPGLSSGQPRWRPLLSVKRMGLSYRPHRGLAAFAILLGLLVACSADEPATVNLMIENFKFVPDSVTIDVGDSITWTNGDPVGHNVQARDGSFRTPLFLSDNSATVTFDTAGTFAYFCGAHPEMVGTVIVEAAGSG